MDIQYFHYQNAYLGMYTVAFELPSKEKLIKLSYGNNTITSRIGKSRVHKDDHYVKAIGRSVSKNKLEEKTLTLIQASFLSDRALYTFSDHDMVYTLQVNKNSDRVYFLSALGITGNEYE